MAMTASTKDEDAQLKQIIIKQLVESGKYDEISVMLQQCLYESGFISELRRKVNVILRSSSHEGSPGNPSDDETLKFSNIISQLDFAELYNDEKLVNSELKQKFLVQLKDFLEENFDIQ